MNNRGACSFGAGNILGKQVVQEQGREQLDVHMKCCGCFLSCCHFDQYLDPGAWSSPGIKFTWQGLGKECNSMEHTIID